MPAMLNQATLPVYGPGGGPWVVDGWASVTARTQDEACARFQRRHHTEPWSAFPETRTCTACGAWGLADHDTDCEAR